MGFGNDFREKYRGERSLDFKGVLFSTAFIDSFWFCMTIESIFMALSTSWSASSKLLIFLAINRRYFFRLSPCLNAWSIIFSYKSPSPEPHRAFVAILILCKCSLTFWVCSNVTSPCFSLFNELVSLNVFRKACCNNYWVNCWGGLCAYWIFNLFPKC